MVPKAVQDAGYTAVGLGVLALKEVQARRKATKARIESTVTDAKALIETVAGQVVKVPALVLPPLCGAVGAVSRALGRQDDASQN